MGKTVLAFDLGASSGRAVLGSFNGNTIELNEIHRFSNDPVSLCGTLYWDALRLFHEIKQGILKAKAAGGFDCMGIDTWGVDFGLIDKKGYLLENPVHYRDLRTEGMIEKSSEYISKSELYDKTGIQFMNFNTIFQLLSLKLNRSKLLQRADKLLFMPDLLAYMLTGEKVSEYSIASTSQMLNIRSKDWDGEILEKTGLPREILCGIVPSGTVIGTLKSDICRELGVPAVPVIAVCGHDTQSAVAAIPAEEDDFAFISSGTWSLFGTELKEPIINEKAKKFDVTNEGGYGYTTDFLKNMCGLWLIQECRRQWKKEGSEYSYAEMEELARNTQPSESRIDPNDAVFSPMGDMPSRICEYCKTGGQPVPENHGEILRCVYESLAESYKGALCGIEDCTGKKYDKIYVVGGGVKDSLLCQMTADFCGVPVYAGSAEATVLGNIAVQLIASGEIKDLKQAREILAGMQCKIYNQQ
ncbi:MAG: rhamnulokinase [Clostridiales bacterium]|nr:rhamnulokinase [Clostridiales bacterium]